MQIASHYSSLQPVELLHVHVVDLSEFSMARCEVDYRLEVSRAVASHKTMLAIGYGCTSVVYTPR
jgi:hypothetical protein